MFNSITINYNDKTHTLGNLVECLLYYNDVYLIISKVEDLPSLWSKIGVDGLIRLREYGLHLFMSTNVAAYGSFFKNAEDIQFVSLANEDMLHRVCEKAVKQYYDNDLLNNEQRLIVEQYYKVSESFSYSSDTRSAVLNDVCNHYLHKEILQCQLKEIDSCISMFNPRIRYEFRPVANGFVFDTNMSIGILEEQTKRAGYIDMSFKHASLLLKMTEVYGIMEFAAKMNSSLSVSPTESIIVSCKQKDILTKYRVEEEQIKNFERVMVSSYSNVANVIDMGNKSIDDICTLLDCAQDFKKWKKSLPDENDFILEYQKALNDNIPWLQRQSGKVTRFFVTSAIGLIPGVGNIAGPLVGALDNFLLDKWISGAWKPSQFVNGELKKFVK